MIYKKYQQAFSSHFLLRNNADIQNLTIGIFELYLETILFLNSWGFMYYLRSSGNTNFYFLNYITPSLYTVNYLINMFSENNGISNFVYLITKDNKFTIMSLEDYEAIVCSKCYY